MTADESESGCAPFVVGGVMGVVLVGLFWFMIPSFTGAICSHPNHTRWQLMNGGNRLPGERICVLTTEGWVPK